MSESSNSAEDIDRNTSIDYEVKYLGQYEAEGILVLYPDRVVFSPKEDHEVRIEIPVAKIVDVRFATEKDISALRVWLVGPVLGTLWKKQHKMLTIDAEDEFGIIQHFVFEGEGVARALLHIGLGDPVRQNPTAGVRLQSSLVQRRRHICQLLHGRYEDIVFKRALERI